MGKLVKALLIALLVSSPALAKKPKPIPPSPPPIVTPQTVVLNGNTAYFCVPGSFFVVRDNLSAGSLVRGTDFQETLTVKPATAPGGTVIAWSWPAAGWAQQPSYPEVAFGNVHPPCLSPPAKQVKNFTALSAYLSYVLGGPDFTYNPLMEMWLSSDAGWSASSFEVELQLDQLVKGGNPYYLPINHHMTAPFSADVVLKPNSPTPTTQVLIFPMLPFGSNAVSNTTLTGSVNGSPGTDPTNADFTQGSLALTKTISGSGTTTTASDGTTVHCVSANYAGTHGSAGNMQMQILSESHMPDATPGQNYYGKLYVANTAGALTNLDDIEVQVKSYDSGFSQLQASGGGNIIASLTSTPQPFGVATTLVANAAYAQGPILYIHSATGAAINATFQVCTPFLGTGGFTAINNLLIDWKAIYADLTAAGVTTGNEYAHGIEIGPEVYNGKGSMTINQSPIVWLP